MQNRLADMAMAITARGAAETAGTQLNGPPGLLFWEGFTHAPNYLYSTKLQRPSPFGNE